MVIHMSEALNSAVSVSEIRPIMTISQSNKLDKELSQRADYYQVVLQNDFTMEPVVVKTPAWILDETRQPAIIEGKKMRREALDAGLDVWAAAGAEEFTLVVVFLGPKPVATAAMIAAELGLRSAAARDIRDVAA